MYHYVDTNDNPGKNCSYVDERDCPDNKCVVGAIANYTSQALCDKATGKALFPGQAQEEAVKFLTHFIGDITQPLHVCGFVNNLHGMWDFTIPQKLLPLKYKGSQDLFAAELIDKIEKGEYKDIAQSWISKRAVTDLTKLGNSAAAAEWATDANGWNCDIVWGAYDSDPKQDFGKAYYEAAIPVIKIQVAKGGYRLAKWLNAVFDTCGSSTSSSSVSSSSTTSASASSSVSSGSVTITYSSAGPVYTVPTTTNAPVTTTPCETAAPTTTQAPVNTYAPAPAPATTAPYGAVTPAPATTEAPVASTPCTEGPEATPAANTNYLPAGTTEAPAASTNAIYSGAASTFVSFGAFALALAAF
ncbi:hypothetical protein HDV03_001436 [Kappamyces sp. JEL0829]|nr:hypothetical protein HDV03_001436 [Kappamyces sp. JEL0829]